MAFFKREMYVGTKAGEKPEYMALLDRTGLNPSWPPSGEYARYVVTIGNQTAWSSPLLRLKSLMEEEYTIGLPPSRKRRRVYLEYIKRKNGRAYTLWLRVPPQVPGVNIPTTGPVRIANFQRMYPPFVRKARRWSASQIQLSRTRRVSVPKASVLRASPETLSRPFLKTIETWNPLYSYTPSIIPIVVYQRFWTGVRTPNFGKLRKSELPVNPHSVTIKYGNVNRSFASMWHKTTGWSSINIRPFTDIYPDSGAPTHLAQATNIAIRRLINKSDLGIGANLNQDMAQIGQTMRLIGNSVNKIVTSVGQLKKGNLLGAAQTLLHGRQGISTIRKGKPSIKKSLSQNWLELQYGWKPLLYDIEGTLKAYANYLQANDFVQRATASGSQMGFLTVTTPTVAVSGQGKFLTYNERTKTTCRYRLRFRLASPLRAFLSQTGFTNPVNLIWELLPWSFVADWFLPVQAYIEAFTAWDGLEFLDGSKTQFTRKTTTCSYHNEQVSNLNSNNIVAEHSELDVEWVKLDRVKLTSFPSPNLPAFRNGFATSSEFQKNAERGLTGIALILSTFGR